MPIIRNMFAKFLVFLCLLLSANANLELWNNFKVKFNKNYASTTEHQARYEVFRSNLANIEEHNIRYEQGLETWYKAVNQFTDLTPEEFKKMLSAAPPKMNATNVHKSAVAIPDSIDWRNQGLVTDVKNQGGCGSCWTFSATGTLEGLYARLTGSLVSLSEQDLMDCCTDEAGYNGAACSGGIVQSGLDYVRDHGIVAESSYPYESAQGSCRQSGSIFQISGYTEIAQNDEGDLKNAVGSVGPVSVCVNADGYQSYGGGIYNDQSCSQSINHGVLVVGYGSESGMDYWIIKNSWGPDWGESGYIRMVIGYNLCAVAVQACYPNA